MDERMKNAAKLVPFSYQVECFATRVNRAVHFPSRPALPSPSRCPRPNPKVLLWSHCRRTTNRIREDRTDTYLSNQITTRTMALPSKDEIKELVSSLNEVAQAYSDAPDLNGYMSRVQILEKTRKLTNALITPDQKPNYHGLNVSLSFTLFVVSEFLVMLTSIDCRAHCCSNLYEAQGP